MELRDAETLKRQRDERMLKGLFKEAFTEAEQELLQADGVNPSNEERRGALPRRMGDIDESELD